MRDGVNDYDLESRFFAGVYRLDVPFGREWRFEREDSVVSEIAIEIARSVFGVYEGDFAPVARDTAGKQEGGIGLAGSGWSRESDAQLRFPAFGFSYGE